MTYWITPLIIFDLVFLPMFHVGGLPFKVGYFAIGLLFLGQMYAGNNSTRGLARELIVLFALLITFSLMGTLIFLMMYRDVACGKSIRNIIIYLLAPMAFVAGAGDARRRHNYIIIYILAYFVVTVLLSVSYDKLGWFVRLYGLEERIASGLYAIRNQGLFFNANISALSMTMMFLWFIGGVKYGFVRVRALSSIIVIGAVFSTVLILSSRNQMLAIGILALVFLRFIWRSKRYRALIIGLIVGVALLFVFHTQLGNVASTYLGYNPFYSLKRGFSSIADLSNLTQSFLRPVQRFNEAWARFSVSPLVGTGFDVTGIKPFEGTLYHNDWLYVLTSSGIIGLLVFASIVYRLVHVDLIFLVPFLLPGMTNCFVYAPTHLVLFMFLAGMVWRRKTG